MNERIPIRYDVNLLPEWIDYALEQYIKCSYETAHRKVLQKYIEPQIKGKGIAPKIVTQLIRIVGARSPLSSERLRLFYAKMSLLSPEERTSIRLQILMETTPFFSDCVTALWNLNSIGISGVEVKQLYERLVARYGDRDSVYRRVRYVLKTLSLLGLVSNHDKRWYWIE